MKDTRASTSPECLNVGRAPLIAATLAFALLSLSLNIASAGFLEADGITHYLYARWSIAEPHLLTDVWARPVVTTLHALPAQLPGTLFGQPLALIGVRAVSLVLALGCGLVTWRVARDLGPEHGHQRPALATLFLLGMPLVILHSFSELTELPFAFLAIIALWAYQRRNWWLLALTAGLLPAARPEGFGFALIAFAGLLLHRRWEVLLVALPLVAWDRLGWWLNGANQGDWWRVFAWLKHDWPYSGQSTYRSGRLLKFVGMLPAVVGPALMPFVLIGIAAALRGTGVLSDSAPSSFHAVTPVPLNPGVGAHAWRWRDHEVRVGWLIAFLPLLVLSVHSLLHWLGKMASSGDVRYLVCVAPFWALLAARGWDWLADRLRWRWNGALAMLAVVVPLIAMHLAYPIVPFIHDAAAREAMVVARWYDQSDHARTHPRLLTDHPMLWYLRDMNPQRTGGGKPHIEAPLPGSLFLWHDVYSTHNADDRYVVPSDMPPRFGWREITPPDFPAAWRVFATDLVGTPASPGGAV